MAELYTKKRAWIRAYTREPHPKSYPDGLARSIHLEISRDGSHFSALNRNYGILFATASIDTQDIIHPKGVKSPWLFEMPGKGFGILAVRVNEDGSPDEESRGSVLFWTTADFLEFQPMGYLSLHEGVFVEQVQCRYDKGRDQYVVLWIDSEGKRYQCESEDLSGSHLISKPLADTKPWENKALEISRELVDEADLYWNGLRSVQVRVPEEISVSSLEEVNDVEAVVVYSDGSSAEKRVDWDLDRAELIRPGTWKVPGTVINEQYPFPLACGFGDPVIFPWEGRYYYTSTNDNLDDIGIYVREAPDVDGLFRKDTTQHLILGLDEKKGFVQTFWAPEFHLIGGELYILFAVSGKQWGPQCHMMKLKKGGSITDPDSWEDPIRVRRKDGTYLTEDGISLDMTYLKAGNSSYVVWSYRRHIGTPLDTGSMLYIARIDEEKPWQLVSDPVLLSRPLYGWENVQGTINNEGPNAFIADGKVYLAYSGGAANGYTYTVGLLSADTKADLLDPSVWKKRCAPVLSHYSLEGIYGPGHNSFFTDSWGNLMIAYHAEDALDQHLRCDAIHRVHFNIHGEPVFDLSPKRDLDPSLSHVEMEVSSTEEP